MISDKTKGMAQNKKGKLISKADFKLYRKLWIGFAIGIATLILFFTLLSVGALGFMPSFEELENPKSNLATEVYSSDGVLLGYIGIENRSNIHYSELSPLLVNALIATEDARFKEHSGIDMRSLLRVFGRTVLVGDKSSGGGSTITQQLAKNLFPREKKSKIGVIFSKFKEWVVAIKLEANYSKNEIIAMYFNTVDFGSNAFGVKSASQTFFGKQPSQLTLEEAAVLVGLLKAPTSYSPVSNPERSLQRRNVVLQQMYKYGYITKEVCIEAKEKPIDMTHYSPQNHNEGLATYFREYLRSYLKDWASRHVKSDGTNYNIYRDGLRIYTTIDSRMQAYAEQAVKEHIGDNVQVEFFKQLKAYKDAPFTGLSTTQIEGIMKQAMKQSERYQTMQEEGYKEEEIKKSFREKIKMQVFTWKGMKDTLMSPWDSILYYKSFLHAGLMSVDPKNGQIKAYVGGINYRYFKYDNVMQGRRQVGSTFKPFVYALAMQDGNFFPCSEVPNTQVCIETPGQSDWCPKNSSNAREGEMVTLKWALANSVNYVTAYLMKRTSPDHVIDLCRKLGIKSPIPPVPSICLGTADLSVYEMTGALSTFANKGEYIQPYFVIKIADSKGVVLDHLVPERTEALSEKSAFLMLELMRGVVESGTGVRLRYKYGLMNPIAGKTGTTDDNSDGWFVGLTPRLTTGVWVGGELRSIHFRSTAMGQGASTALPIWAIYMKKCYEDKTLNLSKGDFERPSLPINVEMNCDKFKEEIKSEQSNHDF